MKYLLIVFLIITANTIVSAQQKKEDTITLAPHVDPNAPRTDAEFPGGKAAFLNYMRLGLEEINPKRGKVIMSFVVEKDGSLGNIEILEGKNKKTNARIIELLNNCLKWKPGTLNGEPVRVGFRIPITIN